MISEFLSRLRFLLTRKDRSGLDREIQFHLEESIAFKIASGLDAAEARRQALIEFGGVERTREQCVRQRPGWWLGTILQDVRCTARFSPQSAVYHQRARNPRARHRRNHGGLQCC